MIKDGSNRKAKASDGEEIWDIIVVNKEVLLNPRKLSDLALRIVDAMTHAEAYRFTEDQERELVTFIQVTERYRKWRTTLKPRTSTRETSFFS